MERPCYEAIAADLARVLGPWPAGEPPPYDAMWRILDTHTPALLARVRLLEAALAAARVEGPPAWRLVECAAHNARIAAALGDEG